MVQSQKVYQLLACTIALFAFYASASESTTDGFIGFHSNQLDSRVGDVPGNRFIANAALDYKKMPMDEEEREATRRLTLAAQMNDQSLLQYSVQEAYLAGNITKKDSIRFGRQNLDWATLDDTWSFGKLNNRRNFDYFEPGREGLTGLNYEHKSSNGMRYKLFASGLYIPELNPSYDINEDRKTIKCKTPWCDAPARTTEIEGDVKSIEYNIEYPSISDVVFRYSVGFNVGWENKHWLADFFYMRKPENNLTTKVTVALDAIRDVVEAQIDPQVYYQDILGSTLKYRNKEIEMYVSAFASRPSSYPDGDREATEQTEIKTAKIREDYGGGGISHTTVEQSVGLNYVARLSPFNRDTEQLAQDPRWNQAVNVYYLRKFGKLSLSGDAKYDMLTRDRLVMVRAFYNLTQRVLLTAGMNMIGTPKDGKSYWSPYTNNDALYAGLRYAF